MAAALGPVNLRENFNRLTAFGMTSRDGKGPLGEELMSLHEDYTRRVRSTPAVLARPRDLRLSASRHHAAEARAP
jgi:hypothetical protein